MEPQRTVQRIIDTTRGGIVEFGQISIEKFCRHSFPADLLRHRDCRTSLFWCGSSPSSIDRGCALCLATRTAVLTEMRTVAGISSMNKAPVWACWCDIDQETDRSINFVIAASRKHENHRSLVGCIAFRKKCSIFMKKKQKKNEESIYAQISWRLGIYPNHPTTKIWIPSPPLKVDVEAFFASSMYKVVAVVARIDGSSVKVWMI